VVVQVWNQRTTKFQAEYEDYIETTKENQ